MKVSPQTLPGTLHLQNQTAFDWGWQGLLAYGCRSCVAVVDPRSVQLLQTLVHHKSNVIKVRWSRQRHHHTPSSPYLLRLASVDTASHCVVWNVGSGDMLSEFELGSKALVDLQWLTTNDACRDLLAVVLAPSTMTIWNADSGTRLSRFTFSETIVAFTFDPFRPEHLVLQSPECFVFVSDFSPSHSPAGGGKKLYMTALGSLPPSSPPPFPHRGRAASLPAPRRLLAGDALKGEESVALVDVVQVTFSHAHRNQLLVAYPREIVIIDTESRHQVGAVLLERNASQFRQVYPCRQRDILYCLHDNGCVSFRVRQPTALPVAMSTSISFEDEAKEVLYDLHCHSEALRISKTCQVYASAVCPTTERGVAVLTSEGRILIWNMEFEQVGVHGQELAYIGGEPPLTLLTALPLPPSPLVEVGGGGPCEGGGGGAVGEGLTLGDIVAPHWLVPAEGLPSRYGLLTSHMLLLGLWSGLQGTPTALRMCPPLTTKNWSFYQPLVAIGTSGGSVFVYNLFSHSMVKEYAVHTCRVIGFEWLSQHAVVCYASTPANSLGHIRSEVATVNLQTGRVTYLRRSGNENGSQTQVETVKISPHKNYIVVKYKDRPLEFWDAKTFSFIRELISNPASFSCIEWAPSHGRPKTHRADVMATVDFDVALGATDSKIAQSPEREHLTVMDESGAMWQIGIEGSKVKVTNTVPTQTWLNNPSSMSWKGDHLAAGDADGRIIFHDLRSSQSRMVETTRAVIKKIRFAPGKGNTKLLVLYSSRIDIRDAMEDSILGQRKWAGSRDGDLAPVEDADWATSDKPVLLTSDGSLHVFDLQLHICQAPVSLAELREQVFCPHLLPSHAALRLKSSLQHQPWNPEYCLDLEEYDDMEPDEKALRQQLHVLPDAFHWSLLDAALGTPLRSFITASLFGDEREVEFWKVALFYLLRERHRSRDPRYSAFKNAAPPAPNSGDIIRPDSLASTAITSSLARSMDDFLGPLADIEREGERCAATSSLTSASSDPAEPSGREVAAMLQEADLLSLTALPPLDLGQDILCDQETYQRMQVEVALLHDCNRYTYEQTKKCAETLLLLGQTDRAVQLLLETDSSSANYYTDALKACLAATIRSSGASQSTIKLVATNLIANARLMEGVQLLTLIDKGLDGCRYLQTYGEWHTSVWLAKATLGERDLTEVLSKWEDHLCSPGVNQKSMAMLIMLSLGQFVKVIETLYSMRHFDQAAVFTEACLEYGLVELKDFAPLIEAVFLEYARYLHSVGLSRGMRHYCGRAGERGRQLLDCYLSSPHKGLPSDSITVFSVGKPPSA